MLEIDIRNIETALLRLYEEKKLKEWIILCKDGMPLAHLHWSICDWTAPKERTDLGQIHPNCFDPLPVAAE
jgi:hypothetical protein